MKLKNSVGIVSYGTYLPKYRIKTGTIAAAWNRAAKEVVKSLGINEKTVPAADEDTVTIAVNAASFALANLGKMVAIGAVYTGSESHPYAVKSTSAIVGEALGIDNRYTAADLEFACKAGSAAMQMVSGMVSAGLIEYGLAIGADVSQSRPGDALEYSAAAAGTAFIFGDKEKEIIARVLYSTSFTSDTPDFWRRELQAYPRHAGRFTGEPAYFRHITNAVRNILEESGMKITEFDHVVLHMPNAAFPRQAAKLLGITENQLAAGFLVPELGNSYSACSLTGLSAVLDIARPGEKILMCSYGSGSGSDAFIFEVTPVINNISRVTTVTEQMGNKVYLDYATYLSRLKMLKLD